MMNYESFKKRVLKEFLAYMPEEYSDCEIELKKVPKVNTCLTGIVIKPKGKPKSFCSPTFYMERLYEQYMECDSFEQVMVNQSIYLEESKKHLPEDILTLDFAKYKDRIVFQIVNTEHNKEMIRLCPHRKYMDLTIVYRVITNLDDSGVSGFLITYDIARSEDLSEKILFSLALENTKRIFPFKVERIEETMMRMMNRWGADKDEIKGSFSGMNKTPEKERVYVISNEYEFFGATALIYKDVVGNLVESIGTDCYILPSSVHELIVLSTEVFSESSQLLRLVKETNNDHVRLSDRLSDSIYVYSIKDGSIERFKEPEEEVS